MTTTCLHCNYTWTTRVKSPKACPRCKSRLDTQTTSKAPKNADSPSAQPVTHLSETQGAGIVPQTIPIPPEMSTSTILLTDEDGNPKPKPYSKTSKCPHCGKQIYTEFAQSHYLNKHEGAQ